MGLDFDGSDTHWSYGGFNKFRARLGFEININLNAMIGFGGFTSWDNVSDDIKYFLNHSDCNGELMPNECLKIAPRLKELVKKWDDNDYDKIKALELADDMEFLAKKNKPLIFM